MKQNHPLAHLKSYQIILGSGSPRRKELLEGLNLPFKIITSDIEEIIPPELAMNKVSAYLAELKANDLIQGLTSDYLLITADTVVIIDDTILGKPKSYDDAFGMIQQLSGRDHLVITGVHIRSKEHQLTFAEQTTVTFESFSEQEIDWYISEFMVMDKAGAYGIQDGMGLSKVARLNGSYYNVMGLPTAHLYNALVNWPIQR